MNDAAFGLLLLMTATAAFAAGAPLDSSFDQEARSATTALREKYGDKEATRVQRGVAQVRRLWRAEDGDAAAFGVFVREGFIPEGPQLDATFERFEFAMERIGGYFTSMERDLNRQVDLDLGPILPIDHLFAALSPRAHLTDDLFENKIAFTCLLNFPLTTLDQRLKDGMGWSRRQWAETRLASGFSTRVPAEVNQKITAALSQADSYISTYNIVMHHLMDEKGRRLFPEKLRLITHWGLRDEIKGRYADPEGLDKQRMIEKVMERIVRQEIPAAAIDNPLVDWSPYSNKVAASSIADLPPVPGKSAVAESERENDERYRVWLEVFRAMRGADPFNPDNPTFIDRRFNIDREIPETEVRALLESILNSPLAPRVARLIQKRLGRPLEPFDIWYVGFKPRGKYSEAELDTATTKRYPTASAYAADIPRLLRDLGFSTQQAEFLSAHIEVDPSRGAGHALGATRRDDKAHLRTRVGSGGMDYKGYNIAVHEMGHNVEQVFSVTGIDHTLLQGVPNTAFTEALAFVFQSRDMELLGLSGPDPAGARMRALEEFWATREIAGIGLVDMGAWRYLYEHPDASPAQFREAVVRIATEIWNKHFAALTGRSDSPLLAIYSHMIDSALYTPDYPLGHLIAFQIEDHFTRHKPIGAEFERICKLGSITPDAWMRQAVGGPLSAEPLLAAATAALAAEEKP